jgi:hypothetical protein
MHNDKVLDLLTYSWTIIAFSWGHVPEQCPGQFPSWWRCRSPEGLKEGAQFAWPLKLVNVIDMLGGHHHGQYNAVCEIVIEQIDYWLQDGIRAEVVIHSGAGTSASSAYVCDCWCSGHMIDRALPAMFKNVDEIFSYEMTSSVRQPQIDRSVLGDRQNVEYLHSHC